MKYAQRKFLLHLLGCFIFLSIPIFSSPDFNSKLDFLHVIGFQKNFTSYILLIVFFYVNYYYFIPKFYFPKKVWIYIALIVISYTIIVAIPHFIFPRFNEMHDVMNGPMGNRPLMPPSNHLFELPEGSSLFQFLLVLSLSFLLRINNHLLALNHEKLKAEVSYLKAQINPHFLFNTLNSLYALTLEKSDAAPDAVIKLSNMMRYVVTESTNDFVSLEKEINYISDYIAMQRLRISEESNLEYVVTANPKGKSIAPLVLIPFIENAFKYGVNAEEDWFIHISIESTAHDFKLKVKNKKVKISFPEDHITEQGIENTRKRLEFIYPGKHELELTDCVNSFEVYLKINLS